MQAKPEEYGKVIVPEHSEAVTVTSDVNIYLVCLCSRRHEARPSSDARTRVRMSRFCHSLT